MKNILIILAVVAIAAGIYFTKFHKSPVEKAFLSHRSAVLNAQRSHSEANLQKWTTTIDSIENNGDKAAVKATETQYWIPVNAASLNFATIVTEKLYAELEKSGSAWTVTYTETLEKDISTYEDRKDR